MRAACLTQVVKRSVTLPSPFLDPVGFSLREMLSTIPPAGAQSWHEKDTTYEVPQHAPNFPRNARRLTPPRGLKFGIGPKRIAEVIETLDLEVNGPEPVEDGCGGVYLLGSPEDARKLAVFKPFDEEVQSAGHMGFIREFAAYLVDDSMAGVPATGIACFPWKNRTEAKIGSIQEYIQDAESAADFGPGLFDVDDIHRIGILDLRIVNCDRHSGNMLFSTERRKLIPIDHGLSFPSAFTDLGKASFDWLLYPAAKEPFSEEVLREIEAIDIHRDLSILRSLGMGLGSELTIWMSTTLLKIAASEGRTLYEIGCMVQRQGDRTQRSVLEELFIKTLQIVKMYRVNFWSVFIECIYSYLNLSC